MRSVEVYFSVKDLIGIHSKQKKVLFQIHCLFGIKRDNILSTCLNSTAAIQ